MSEISLPQQAPRSRYCTTASWADETAASSYTPTPCNSYEAYPQSFPKAFKYAPKSALQYHGPPNQPTSDSFEARNHRKCPILQCKYHTLGFPSSQYLIWHLRKYHANRRIYNDPFKCPVKECEYSEVGFATGAENYFHVASCHQAPNPDDSLENTPPILQVTTFADDGSVESAYPYTPRLNPHVKTLQEPLSSVSPFTSSLLPIPNRLQDFWLHPSYIDSDADTDFEDGISDYGDNFSVDDLSSVTDYDTEYESAPILDTRKPMRSEPEPAIYEKRQSRKSADLDASIGRSTQMPTNERKRTRTLEDEEEKVCSPTKRPCVSVPQTPSLTTFRKSTSSSPPSTSCSPPEQQSSPPSYFWFTDRATLPHASPSSECPPSPSTIPPAGWETLLESFPSDIHTPGQRSFYAVSDQMKNPPNSPIQIEWLWDFGDKNGHCTIDKMLSGSPLSSFCGVGQWIRGRGGKEDMLFAFDPRNLDNNTLAAMLELECHLQGMLA